MRSLTRWSILAGVAVGLAISWSVHSARAGPRTPITLTRIYTGADGKTHSETVDIALSPTAGRFARWVEDSESSTVSHSHFARFAPGFVQDWHPAPQRRYVITLTGRGEIELAGGEKILLQPGRVLQAEDVTGQGHILRTVGDSDWTALVVQLGQ
jgi:hypothetical protein